MKLRTACTTFAIALAACAVSPSLTFADDFVPSQQQQLSIADQLAQLKADIVADTYSCVELSERVDVLVKRIDKLLDNGAENRLELIRQRKLALALRSQIKCDQGDADDGEVNGEDNGSTLIGSGSSCNCGGGGAAGAVGPTSGGGVVRSVGGGASGGGGGGGGLGSAAVIGGIAAAIAIPLSTSNGSSGGTPMSPSEIEPEPKPEPINL